MRHVLWPGLRRALTGRVAGSSHLLAPRLARFQSLTRVLSGLRLGAVVVGLVVAAVVAAGCGLPTDATAQPIDPEELPENLRPGFTATTTTTTPTPLTETRSVYLLQNPPDIERTIVVEVQRQVERNATLADVLATLLGQATSLEESDAGYFNTLESFQLLSAGVAGGVATIDIVHLSPVGEDQPPSVDELQFAAAQLVFTATASDGVDGIRILLDGLEVSVPTSDADAEPGSVLGIDAYEQFHPDFAPTPTPTTTAPDL